MRQGKDITLNRNYDDDVSIDIHTSISDLDEYQNFQPRLDKVDVTKDVRIVTIYWIF